MGSIVVVNPDERIEAFLPLQETEGSRIACLLFEGEMHPLVAALLTFCLKTVAF